MRLDDPVLLQRVVSLNHQYAECLDDNRLADWPELFTDDCRYYVHPRENVLCGLEGYWLYFESKGMLRDRVVSLREVNIYQVRYERRLIGNVRIAGQDGETWIAKANYMLTHTDNEGRSTLFSVGEYRDRIRECDGHLRFCERAVIPDTFLVKSHLSMPI